MDRIKVLQPEEWIESVLVFLECSPPGPEKHIGTPWKSRKADAVPVSYGKTCFQEIPGMPDLQTEQRMLHNSPYSAKHPAHIYVWSALNRSAGLHGKDNLPTPEHPYEHIPSDVPSDIPVCLHLRAHSEPADTIAPVL
ncbi:MAG: hypothetical protein II141_09790 [Clostridia bacterium]|nr:hypothetical protein [Clostridia bacterium]